MAVRIWAVALMATATAAWAGPSQAAQAEAYFQRGWQAERMSDAAFARWVRTIKVGNLDEHVDRSIFALDQYSNAVRLNPAHWRAQRQLGGLYHALGGSQAHSQLAICHLVAYMALRPEDSGVPAAKERVDTLLQRLHRRIDYSRAADEADAIDALRDGATLEAFRGFVGAFQDMAGRRLGRLTPVSAATPGSFAETQDLGIAFHEAMAGIWKSRLDTAGEALSGDRELLENAVSRSAAYVSNYLYFIGAMHRLMQYLDARGVAYDPRLPNALIGESITQMRLLLTRRGAFKVDADTRRRTSGSSRFTLHIMWIQYDEPDPDIVTDEYTRLAELGTLTADDLWGTRDYSRPLPEQYTEAGAIEQPGRDRQAYESVAAASSLELPGYRRRPEEDWGIWNEARLAGADVVAFEAYKEWVKWRNVHLWGCAAAYGLTTPDELYLRDYARVGSGEISRWEAGPMGRVDLLSAAPGERDWLYAEAR